MSYDDYNDPFDEEEELEYAPSFTSYVRCYDCGEKLGVVDVWTLNMALAKEIDSDLEWYRTSRIYRTVHALRPWDPDWVLGLHKTSACQRSATLVH